MTKLSGSPSLQHELPRNLSMFKGYPDASRRSWPSGLDSGTWLGEPLALGLVRFGTPRRYPMSQETPVQTVLACSQCGRSLAPSELVHIAGNWVCADCKPAFLSRVMASGAAGASPLAWHYGGFWIRFGARFIDGLIFTVPMLIFFAIEMPSLIRAKGQAPINPNAMFAGFAFITFFLVFFLVGGCYEVLMLKYRSGTVGKMACG